MYFDSQFAAINYVELQIKKLNKNSGYTTSGRKYAYERAIETICDYHLEEFYKIDSSARYYENRLIKKQGYHEFEQRRPIEACGCYLLGNTAFNPYTGEKFYWIKIGQSGNIKKRMRDYSTCNPTVFKIDCVQFSYEKVLQEEYHYHCRLEAIGTRAKDSKEWFQVSEHDYLEICSKGFYYFE